MGDRVSISFKRGDQESVVLFSHWGGMSFVETARSYINELKKEMEGSELYPLQRLEPETVMVDFIRAITKDKDRVTSNYYLGATDEDGDNSDNGHYTIRLDKAKGEGE